MPKSGILHRRESEESVESHIFECVLSWRKSGRFFLIRTRDSLIVPTTQGKGGQDVFPQNEEFRNILAGRWRPGNGGGGSIRRLPQEGR